MIKLMFICNDPDMARYAEACGVDRIFVDLEINGKFERQGHRDTLISTHSIEDIIRVRSAINESELLVRVNPLHDNSKAEVEAVIAAGADLLMLPMFESVQEVEKFVALVKGRAKVIPLVETPAAVQNFTKVISVPGVSEVFIGLNDLHLALGKDFMFELLTDGSVEDMASICRKEGMRFGFGGIARIGEGLLPGESVLAEHLRLGSSSVILSRTFHRTSTSLDELHANIDFAREVTRLREYEAHIARRGEDEIEVDHEKLVNSVMAITNKIKKQRVQ